MSLVNRIKKLCDEQKITIAELERKTGISNGQVRKWDTSSPSISKIELVSEFFDVSVDYLLGKTDKKRYYELTDKDEANIEKDLEKMIAGLDNGGYAAFGGRGIDDLDEEDRELLIDSLRHSLKISKKIAKQKFTPKKYRN
ncbi:helix-turn-helix domain-containing protein [Geomicrobium sediminis]|uniref:Transcriptional regulator with XRE-family HTH domain n=1 Tax=Geomicrobium sediminis TaxID=1347788 RepID=A0ABS2P719_9BACL|nr:helix-turn-helix transcriptional regulator [Geomicrobium sediminis]MBM7631136.1 transcriptional regulator with XRE-family HTH domain [Geomicrobium sediminis]